MFKKNQTYLGKSAGLSGTGGHSQLIPGIPDCATSISVMYTDDTFRGFSTSVTYIDFVSFRAFFEGDAKVDILFLC